MNKDQDPGYWFERFVKHTDERFDRLEKKLEEHTESWAKTRGAIVVISCLWSIGGAILVVLFGNWMKG